MDITVCKMHRVACGCGLSRSENVRLAEVSITGALGHSHPDTLVSQCGKYPPIITIRGKWTLFMRAVEKSTTLLAEPLQENQLFADTDFSVFVRKPQPIDQAGISIITAL